MTDLVQSYTQEIKALIGQASYNILEIGDKLIAVKKHLAHGDFLRWLEDEFEWSERTARNMMSVAIRFKSANFADLAIDQSALYLLSEKSTPDAFVANVIEVAREGTVITHSKAKQMLATYKELHTPGPGAAAREKTATPEPPVTPPQKANTPKQASVATPPTPRSNPPTFNPTNENIDWAKWSWNPVTGCLHNCVYCYARDIAERLYPEKFVPTFHPERLSAPHHTKVPAKAESNVGYRNVFVCSMADLFGKWVPQEWIDAVLDAVRAAPQWNFLFLTKFPQRLAEIDWPENSWVGTTVDEQYRVDIAEKAFRKVNAPVKWLSCEPLREQLTFSSLDMFDWVVVGGQSQSTQAPAFQPPWEWVEHLWQQARASGCLLYWKPNLHTRPQEYPHA